MRWLSSLKRTPRRGIYLRVSWFRILLSPPFLSLKNNKYVDLFEQEVNKYTDLKYKSIINTQEYSKKFSITTSPDEAEIASLTTDQEKKAFKANLKINEINQTLTKIKALQNLEDIIYYSELSNISEELASQIKDIDKNGNLRIYNETQEKLLKGF